MTARPLFVALISAAVLIGTASPLLAEARDAADRSLRSDHNALENDLRRDQLKPTGRPLILPWQWNGDANSQVESKPKKKGAKQ